MRTPVKKNVVSFRTTATHGAALTKLAKKRGTTVSNIVEKIVVSYLRRA